MERELLINTIRFKSVSEMFNLPTEFITILGPCAVESAAQMRTVAEFASNNGVAFFRAGAYKPRTSPYTFQGLGREGLKILRDTCDEYSLFAVTELLDIRDIDAVCAAADIIQIGSRNMQNFPLLREVGQLDRPVILKRGFMSTTEEFLLAAEYILSGGNHKLILCERGVRSFDNITRNLMDLESVALIKLNSNVPIIADLSHSLGRKDIMLPMARAARAVGADGIMAEVHPCPAAALSDSDQQLDITEATALLRGIRA